MPPNRKWYYITWYQPQPEKLNGNIVTGRMVAITNWYTSAFVISGWKAVKKYRKVFVA